MIRPTLEPRRLRRCRCLPHSLRHRHHLPPHGYRRRTPVWIHWNPPAPGERAGHALVSSRCVGGVVDSHLRPQRSVNVDRGQPVTYLADSKTFPLGRQIWLLGDYRSTAW